MGKCTACVLKRSAAMAQEISHFVCNICLTYFTKFQLVFSCVAVAQWIKRWGSNRRVVPAEAQISAFDFL